MHLRVTVSKAVVGQYDLGSRTFSGSTILNADVLLEPCVTVWMVAVENGVGLWREVFGSEDAKNAFVRGLTAASEMLGGRAPELREHVAELRGVDQ